MERIMSNQAQEYAAGKYQKTLPLLKGRAAEVAAFVDGLAGDERVLMEFLYGTMPVCDSADYDPQLMYAYVTHALFLRREKAWTRELPEDVFLNYVLYYRVNNENITDCRKWFYDMLNPLIENLGQEDAVKEVNYWCARQACYTASDGRTLGPVGVFKSGSGRCGEESTFLVTALRSVGIAARQVYTPRWAHCDDNHAWVEAWVEGNWRFLGACEPEEVLNKGWFTNASSRAMMVHTRVFSDYISAEEGRKEEITERDGAALFFNDTSFYAKTGKLTVQVKDEGGAPVSGAKVSFSLLNAAEYYPVSVVYTDEEGDLVTSIVNQKDCVFTCYDEKGYCYCAIEKAFRAGKTDFYKPISCHLYPIRIGDYGPYKAVNYHRWDVCKAAVLLGKKENLPVYKFLKEPLVRKFGEEWYKELEVAAEELKKRGMI